MRKNRRLYSLIQSYQLCLLQLKFVLHCYVSAGLTSAPLGLCLRCCKKTRGKKRRLDNAVAGMSHRPTAGEGETSEGNLGNSNGDAVDVAPPARYKRLKTK